MVSLEIRNVSQDIRFEVGTLDGPRFRRTLSKRDWTEEIEQKARK